MPAVAAIAIAAWGVLAAGDLLGGQERPRLALAAFLAAYFAVWTAFAVVALAGDSVVHTVVDHWPWLDAHPHLVTGGVLAAAGVGQLTGLTERCLDACRNPLHFLLRYYRHGIGAAWRLGLRHGTFCLGCCWPLMLVMFGVAVGSVPLMFGLAAVMLALKLAPGGRRFVRPVGVGLVGGGCVLAVAALFA